MQQQHTKRRGPKPFTGTIAERFWPNVDRSGGPDACWPWLRSRTRRGYGNFRLHDGTQTTASRVAFLLANPDIELTAPTLVCHRCDNPPCCNPAHLFPGSNADNLRDAGDKGRIRWGERHHGAKLTTSDIRRIRERRAGGATYRSVGREFGVSWTTIRTITDRGGWRHLEE